MVIHNEHFCDRAGPQTLWHQRHSRCHWAKPACCWLTFSYEPVQHARRCSFFLGAYSIVIYNGFYADISWESKCNSQNIKRLSSYVLIKFWNFLNTIHKRCWNTLGGSHFRCCKILEERSKVNQGQNFEMGEGGIKHGQKISDNFYCNIPSIEEQNAIMNNAGSIVTFSMIFTKTIWSSFD